MKNDMIDKIVKWFTHNRWIVAGLILSVACALWVYGCQITTTSPFTGDSVTVEQLDMAVLTEEELLRARGIEIDAIVAKYNSEVEVFAAKVDQSYADLERKYETRKKIIDIIGELSIGLIAGEATPANVAGSLLLVSSLVMGGGFYMNGRRKDKVIEQQKAEK